MSKAFDRAMDEIARVWEASDHFDSKVLQFISIVTAGTLAAAAIAANKFPVAIPLSWPVVFFGVAGVAGLLAFMGLALFSAIGLGFAGPIDPRELVKYPHYLEEDEQFEEDAFSGVADAFDRCLQGQERKWRFFSWSLWALGFSVLCLAAAGTIYVISTTPRGSATMPKDPPISSPAQPMPAKVKPMPQVKPVLGPYEITKGRTIPNEPITGPYPRDTNRHRSR